MSVTDLQIRADRKIDTEALFRELSLSPTDGARMREDWRRANLAWRIMRDRRTAETAGRIQEHLRQFEMPARPAPELHRHSGSRRAVWCVELQRRFRSLTEAAAFVDRCPNNILQAMRRGIRCGPYHWEAFDGYKYMRMIAR